jgi:dimethylamine/trimethylamine dehydrogenase
LHELGVELVVGHVIDEISPGEARGHLGKHAPTTVAWKTDAVVLVTQRIPNNELYRALAAEPARLAEAGIDELYRVGDCIAPRPQVADAIFDGHRLAREIDSEDPSTPRPWIREDRVLGATDADYDRILGDDVPVRPCSEPSAVTAG